MGLVRSVIAVLIGTTLFSANASDDDAHFKAIVSTDIASALCNLKTYNAELQQVTGEKDVDTMGMLKVHELTYTLENALQKIQAELTTIAADLEEVHQSSESHDQTKVKSYTEKYINGIDALLTSATCEK